ncbi:MAG: cytochrome P450 [Chloroflexi bacterium]|nr:MAG: cytochrome P450 [Chloroflexota bacterium]
MAAIPYPTTPPAEPFIGHLRLFRRDTLRFLEGARDYGDIVHLRFLGRHGYMLNHPDYIHQVLVQDAKHFTKTPMFRRNAEVVLGQGLLLSEGDFHRRQRRLLQPAFHHQRIAAYGDIMVSYTQRMMAEWGSEVTINMAEEMMRLTMQIVAKALFNADVGAEAAALGEAITVAIETAAHRIMSAFSVPAWLPTPANRERKRQFTMLNSAIYNIIQQRRESGEDTGDLLSMLLQAQDEDDGSRMSDKQVRDEVMTLFIAGHETTANALTWTLYLLSQHPSEVARLREELDSVLGDRSPTFADLPNLRYTEMVVKEAMRLYPPAWILSRMPTEPITIGGYVVHPQSVVIMSQWAMHRHPNYWEEPERFDPTRFTPEKEQARPKFAYFPFGGGPRICIGNSFAMMEATLVLATIMQQYDVALAQQHEPEPEPLITLRPKGGLQLKLTRR